MNERNNAAGCVSNHTLRPMLNEFCSIIPFENDNINSDTTGAKL